MIKAIKKRLSLKIFFITFVSFSLVCSGTFLSISRLLPKAYSDLLNGNVDKKAMLLADQLADYNKLSECEDLLKSFSEETNAVFWIEDVLCEVVRSQMERAVQNIIVNAIRYSPDGAQVKVAASIFHSTVHCKVENTGIHIPDDTLPHLFEAFYRADYSRNRGTGGTGLGLYIVKTVMENHQAKYGIKNTEQGVMFWFDLPGKAVAISNSI